MGSLLVCGKCGYDREKAVPPKKELRKVIRGSYADILCEDCIKKLDQELDEVAKKHLGGFWHF